MAPKVNVWSGGKWYGPSYPDAGDLPAAPEAQPVAQAVEGSAPTPPPKAGPGSSRAKWAAYADANDVEVPDGADRDDIIAALRAAKVPVGQDD